MNYDFIGKLETFKYDMVLLFDKRNLKDRISLRKTLNLKINEQLNTIDNRTATYFAMISKEKKMQLYEIYKLDFLLFGYSPDQYLWMFKPPILLTGTVNE